MPLSWTEIRDRAATFQRDWKNVTSEQAESQSFWSEFLNVFGVNRRRVAVFEKHVAMKRAKSVKNGRIDLFWPGKLLVEMKSAGQDLDKAFEQAADYFEALPDRDLPRYLLVSDFKRFRLFDLEEKIDHPEFRLDQLKDKARLFGFIAGYQAQVIKPQNPVNAKAAERMGRLHDALKASGYAGHALEVLLVRLLFCLFADDTGIFQPAQSFRDWLEAETKPDGSDMGRALVELFDVLNTAEAARQTSQRDNFASFPYINGSLFSEPLRPPAFDAKTRELLLEACALDWTNISPAIFGALFQSIMSGEDRRKLGAHYTSEENILKLIKPLFLDELRAEFEKIKSNANRLAEFHKRLRTLTFFDPACGCGNFLVIAYRELRLLELDILRAVNSGPGSRFLDIHGSIAVNVDQFYGIEIEEFPAQIAQVAMWLTDHQMNRMVSDEFGAYYARIPLVSTAHIRHGNALRTDWNDVLPAERCSFLLGNPPFVGAKFMNDGQRADAQAVFGNIASSGLLDFVAAWYVKAAKYLRLPLPQAEEGWGEGGRVATRCAFVSTNSITQGEQVGVLWGWLLAQGIKIHFAHRTFRWSNEASGKAAVHCVIVGFGLGELPTKTIFEYDDVNGEPHPVAADNISPYLVNAPNVILMRRSHPVCKVPDIGIGNKPIDGGNYLFTNTEMENFVRKEPASKRFFRRWIGADELLQGTVRWCLWLGDCPPSELRAMAESMARVAAVRRFRLDSKSPPTQKLADTPTRFHVENFPRGSALVFPRHSSETRAFVPLGFFDTSVLVGDACLLASEAGAFEFGVLSSTMHNAWIRLTCGRIKSDFRLSASIVYNNFPWPDLPANATTPSPQPSPARGRGGQTGDVAAEADASLSKADAGSAKLRTAIESAAQGVLDARAAHPESSLADLYDPVAMPPDLTKAHQKLDAAVDAAYFAAHAADGAKKSWRNDAERVAFLFTLYQKFTSFLPTETAKPKRSRKPNPA
jgi:hypothetical protein